MADYKTDIEIAQEAEMLPISQVAEAVGLDGDQLEHYGKYKAKVDIHALEDLPNLLQHVQNMQEVYGLPICMAKTQYSFSDDQKLLGAPTASPSRSATSRFRQAPVSSWRSRVTS